MLTATEYQRVRLWTGISLITLNTAFICALYLIAPLISRWVPDFPVPLVAFLLLSGAAFLVLPLEFLSGQVVETAFRRPAPSPKCWLRLWTLTALAHVFGATIAVWLFALAFEASSIPKWLFLTPAIFLAFISGLWVLYRRPSRVVRVAEHEKIIIELNRLGISDPEIEWVGTAAEKPANAMAAGFSMKRFFATASLANNFTPRETALVLLRESGFVRSGKRLVGFLIALLWLAVGSFLALFIPAESPLQAGLGGAVVMTLWSLCALFVWPHLNRRWATQEDVRLARLTSPEETKALLHRLQTFNQTDSELASGKEAVFHPIPALERRIESLKRE